MLIRPIRPAILYGECERRNCVLERTWQSFHSGLATWLERLRLTPTVTFHHGKSTCVVALRI
ncbi:hypothetical protein M404DRAFT_476797 [Pisolithus tinctorius Marx 270]|uniref:Uncharacterized protein n=1 Tax=Pisolithus tinctorius Marx 270 TaxID=870435 RepID=A0A0C3PY12_PISTI|nr:hypothetical protein M404DRAFT_476797 [Pisolithus tinctorius Marx 270]